VTKTRSLLVALILIALVLSVTSCSGGKNSGDTLKAYLEALIKKDFAAAYDLLSEGTRQANTLDEFKAALAKVEAEKGRLTGYENVRVGSTTALDSLTSVTLIYTKDGTTVKVERTFGFRDEKSKWKLGNF
jgi:hypothetical protein